MVRSPRSATGALVFQCHYAFPCFQLMRANECFHARQIFFRFTEPLQRLRLSRRKLEAQPENHLRQIFLLREQFVHA